MGKPSCEDVTEGKYSFPVVHAISTHPNDRRIDSILKQRTKNPELKLYLVSILRSFGSMDYTVAAICRIQSETYSLISGHGDNPQLRSLVGDLWPPKQAEPSNGLG